MACMSAIGQLPPDTGRGAYDMAGVKKPGVECHS